jgi:hypothetical protein
MAQIRVNKQQWEELSAADQQKIVDGLRGTGALKDGDTIIGDEDTPAFDENSTLEPMWNPIKDICKALCDTAAASAMAWCTANTAGIGLAACIAAAESARKECKKRC